MFHFHYKGFLKPLRYVLVSVGVSADTLLSEKYICSDSQELNRQK